MELRIINREEQDEILGNNSKRLAWGYYFPESAGGGVGARMLFKNGELQVLSDRVTWANRVEIFDDTVRTWVVDTNPIQSLQKFVTEQGIQPDSEAIIYGIDGKFRLLATPRASFGYMYLSMWI